MKKFVLTLFILGVVGTLGFFILKKYPPEVIKNSVSSVIPANKDVKEYLPLSSETLSPFKIPVGYKMDIFADLKNDLPRVLEFDDNGNLIVSLTSKGKVVVLTDNNFDLKSDSSVTLLSDLDRPHGLETNGNYLYVAETDGVSRYLYNSKSLTIGEKEQLFSLPSGGRHFSRTIRINNNKLYTAVGSSCDVCVEDNEFRSTILVSNLDGSDLKVFAKGLRNTVFFDFDSSGRIWGADMGRDMLGDHLPPDEVNIIEEGKDYGWPYCYGNRVKDMKFNSDASITCDTTEPPVYELPAHSAPLGFVFDNVGNAFVALHGSWNSSVPVGYKIVKLLTFAGGVSSEVDFVSGFIEGKDKVLGRPAGLTFDKDGNLYIADDKAGLIYVISN